jgi:AraC family transcriptional regulator
MESREALWGVVRAMASDVSVAELSYAENQFQPRHSHGETTISIVLSGSLLERVAKTEEVASPLSVVVKPGGTEHEDHFGPRGARTLQIRLAPALAARMRDWRFPVDQWRWIHGTAVIVPFLRVLRLVRQCGTSGAAIADAATEVVAALSWHQRDTCRAAPRWLELARQQIDDSQTSTLRVNALAHAARVHRVHLAREFRRYFGVSVIEYMQRSRVRRAAALLADTRTSLSSLSFDAGYADQSHLCRIFKRETGLTPLAFRRLVSPSSC